MPILAAVTPGPALGVVVAVYAGQTLRQALVQLLVFGLSASNRYSVRPPASVRNRPSRALRSLMDEPVVFAAARPVLWELLPPATISVMTAATAATAVMGVRRRFIGLLGEVNGSIYYCA